MNERQFERLVQNLQDVMRCPNCSAGYFLDDIHYLGQLDAMTFLHLRCPKCGTPVFASVAMASQDGDLVGSADVSTPQIKIRKLTTDESPQSVKSTTLFKRVTHDDVLDVHDALFRAHGDMGKFLKK